MGASRQWYRFAAQAESGVADLWIYDYIGIDPWDGSGVGAKAFIDELTALPASVTALRVHVNSGGGDVFDGVAIANALRAQSTEKSRTVEVLIEGLAASAATLITSAGDSIRIAQNALMMIHDPSALVWGPAAEMRKMAEVLDTVRDAIVATYRWVSPLSAEKLAELMAATTWMDADEAVKNGLATDVIAAVKVEASLRPEVLARLGTIPDAYRAQAEPLVIRPAAPTPAPAPAAPAKVAAEAREVLAACKAAGCLDLADELLEAKASLAEVTARVAAAKEIRAVCATAKLPDLAAGYIQARVPLDVVRAHLTTLTAKFDAAEITTALTPDAERPRAKARINVAAIYAERNQLATTTGGKA